MRIARHLVLILLSLPAISFAAGDSWTLITADFQSSQIVPISIDETGIQTAQSTIPWKDVLELDRTTAPPQPGGGFLLHLNGGDQIGGDLISIANDTVSLQNPLLGQLDVPEDQVSAILRSGASADGVDQPRKTDSLHLANGDVSSGVVESCDQNTLAILADGAQTPANLNMQAISAILLADPNPTTPPADGWRVRLTDGSSLTVPILKLSGETLSIGLTPRTMHKLDVSSVADIEQINGPVQWLTSLTPTQVIYRPYFDENFPPQFDHPVGEPTLSIRDRFPAFRHGIGVHSYTELTYAIPSGFSSFRVQFAVDSIPGSDMSKADVNVRLRLDDKVVKEFQHVHFAPPSPPVILNVGGASTLSLEVDFGDNLNAQGRFVWLDPAFVRGNSQ